MNTTGISLKQYLSSWSSSSAGVDHIARIVESMATTSTLLARVIARASATDIVSPGNNEHDGNPLGQIGILAHNLFENALSNTDVGILISEKKKEALILNPSSQLGIALNPVGGISNLETNIPIGPIFSIFEFGKEDLPLSKSSFIGLQGTSQTAAGFFVFGPQTMFVLTVKDGTHIFSLDPESSEYCLSHANVQIPESRPEVSVDASNYRHWDDSIRGYVDDCMAGNAGPWEENFNIRWFASLVVEAYHIFIRGGGFLYPRDMRPGFESGRLRLLYEAFPIALMVEQAGGLATDGENRILDQVNEDLHGRTPLIFGSTDKVEQVARYHATPPINKNRYALFESRQLLRN